MYICWDNAFTFFLRNFMRILHILFFLVGVQLMINGVFFSSSLLTAVGAALICLFILVAAKKPLHHHTNGHHAGLWPTYHNPATYQEETYFAPMALIALIGGALAYLFLPIENVYEKTAITLAGTWLFYLIMASFAHGFRVTIKNVLWLLFWGLFLLGFGAALTLRRTPIKLEANVLASRVQNILHTNGSGDVNENNNDIVTGSGDQFLSGDTALSGDVMDESTGLVDTTSNIPLTWSGDIAITYGQLIPYIVNKYQMTAGDQPNIDFVHFPQHDNRYQAFKTAYYNRFFSRSVNPEKLVSCDNYVVFIGLAEKRPLSYTAGNVYDVFRNEAERRQVLYGCRKWAYVKRANLF